MPFPGIHPFPFALPEAGAAGELQQWLAARPELQPRTMSGHRLRFVDPPADGEAYEARIDRCGEVATRAGDPHDHFNALVWINFPSTKAVLNARHVAATDSGRWATRGGERDTLTHFDECGAVVLAADPLVFALIREFRWKELFWERRSYLRREASLVVFGHATLAALHAPFRGLTVKTLFAAVTPAWFTMPVEARVAELDQRLAARWSGAGPDPRPESPRDLHPLPLLGWPGVIAGSEDESYFDDTAQFRPGRRERRPGQAL